MIREWFWFNGLESPLWLWLSVPAVLLCVSECMAKAPGAIVLSTGDEVARLVRQERSLARYVPPVLRCLGLLLLILALAGPRNGYRSRTENANVVDIMLCVDVSSSMAEQDFFIGMDPANRLDVTKIAVANFIANRRLIPEERFGVDRLGLILYAGIAWTACPLTLDYGILEYEIGQVEPATNRDRGKNGTAIGAAVGLAVRRLSQSEARSKVIVLLTDGVNNRYELDPVTAAQVAAAYKVRIYTLGVGPVGDAQQMGSVTARARSRGNLVDEATLRRIAEITGGSYFRATDMASLEEAYREINTLEATEIEAGDVYEYEEAHLPWLLLGAVAVWSAAISRRAWFEVLP
jgi:Ca-activated chloride channel family protein